MPSVQIKTTELRGIETNVSENYTCIQHIFLGNKKVWTRVKNYHTDIYTNQVKHYQKNTNVKL